MAKILIIDDDNNFIESTKSILQTAGYNPIGATSVSEGMKLAETESPDLILLDVTLSEPEDGLKLGKEFIANSIPTPIIILENVAKVAALSTDTSDIAVEAYAEKPIDGEKLINKIKVIINR